ncbi:hypothetical protein Aduo_000772 [Ancylostoma duodenale]
MMICSDFDPDPPTYKTIMSVLSVVTPPVNLFAMFCILRKSPSQMGSYKWFLLAYQSTSTTFDFLLTVLVLPVVFFPIPMGYPDSAIARKLSFSANVALSAIVITVPVLTVCIVVLFLYRCHVIIPQQHVLKVNRKGQNSIITTLLFIFCGPVILSLVWISPDQVDARKSVLAEYSCAQSVIDAPRLHIYTELSVRPLAYAGMAVAVLAAAVALSALLLSFYFLSRMNHLSQRTKHMQRRFLVNLCVQAAIPTFGLLIPLLIILKSKGFVLGQDAGNVTFCCMAAHGFTSPLSLIFCNDAYRAFALARLRFPCIYIKQKPVASTSEQNIRRLPA